MATDEEKCKLGKLLQGLEVPEVKLTERCSDLVKSFHQRFGGEVEAESRQESEEINDGLTENPYKVDPKLLEENEKKLKELLAESKRYIAYKSYVFVGHYSYSTTSQHTLFSEPEQSGLESKLIPSNIHCD